jgi:hypothetical protein
MRASLIASEPQAEGRSGMRLRSGGVGQAGFLKRQLSFPVSTISQ